MTSVKRAIRRFTSLEKAALAPIHEFWRTHNYALLGESASFLRALDHRVDTHVASPIHDVIIAGWLSGHSGYKLSIRTLRRMNPGYHIVLKREDRKDVVTGDSAGGQPLGFRIEAHSEDALNPFVLGVVAPDARIFSLPASNVDVAERMSNGYPGLRVTVHNATETATPPFGYVDYLMKSPRGVTSERSTWLAAIVHHAPKEMLELVDSDYGQFLAADALKVLSIYPSDASWADRFNLVALGGQGEFVSDLVPVTVERPNRTAAPSAGTGTRVPEFVRRSKTLHSVPGARTMASPSEDWLHLKDALVQDGGTVTVGDSLINFETSADPSLDFVAGQWETVFGSRTHPDVALLRRRPLADEFVPEGILLSGRNDSNWYHWLIEYLPRVMQLEGTLGPDVPFIVSSRTPPSGLDALRSLTDRSIVVLDPSLAYPVELLHVVAPPVQILDTTRVPWSEGLCMNPAPLLAIRDKLGLNSGAALPSRHVFLRRQSSHRGLLNEAVLAKIAARHGLEVLDPGAMSWSEQVALFSSASLLVGASGAVMANYLLMSPGSRILALTSDGLGDFVLPAAIASIVGVDFTYLTGPGSTKLSKSDNRNNWLHSDFSISPGEFESTLRRTLRSLLEVPDHEVSASTPSSLTRRQAVR
ncbi:glycosyltransferase family 61 protein [Cryobacterium mannosilyticum]|uniref:Glycosyltransferase family 61 protein n=1 Tax=Cryobacterium mannosilyticum TaxID=1259190 RepID=A0A4R8W310_9MICO|nr:glycosyltransferase 61 family protein [Cryobacterium mannosilyticum]TFC01225.1 glycosyltransferase family 61 protein [Cryobacterium mannosilyticum]